MFKKEQRTSIDPLIIAVVEEMTMYGPEADEYPALLEKLERLMKVKTKTRRPRLTPDAVISGVGTLAAVALIAIIERDGPITSKATMLFSRPK